MSRRSESLINEVFFCKFLFLKTKTLFADTHVALKLYHFHSADDDSLTIMQRWQSFKSSSYWLMSWNKQIIWSTPSLIANKSHKNISRTSEKISFACERSLNETDRREKNLFRRLQKQHTVELDHDFCVNVHTAESGKYKNTFVYVPTSSFWSLLSNITTSS